MKILSYKPTTIEEAIADLFNFFKADMWYASKNEWKTEEDVDKFLDAHFKILLRQIKCIKEEHENNNK